MPVRAPPKPSGKAFCALGREDTGPGKDVLTFLISSGAKFESGEKRKEKKKVRGRENLTKLGMEVHIYNPSI